MGTTGLVKRLEALEQTLLRGSEVYVMVTETWDMMGYLVLRKGEMEKDYYPHCNGPFLSLREANAWSLKDLEARFEPAVLERVLKEHSLEELLHREKGFTVNIVAEFLDEMLRTDDLDSLSPSDRKLRESYLADKEKVAELKTQVLGQRQCY
jgi:hypothetical protein